MYNIDTEHFRQLLMHRHQEVEDTLGKMKEHGEGEQSERLPTELSHYDNHPAEIGSILYETEHNNAIKVHQEYVLAQIHQALKRMDEGTYGQCVFCHREIGQERLEALPYVRLCIDCESERSDNIQLIRSKPPYVEEELHEKELLNEWDDTEFEGLDQWNDLQKYGSSDTPQDISANKDMEEFYTNEIDNQGIVDPMDRISNEQYRRQLPD